MGRYYIGAYAASPCVTAWDDHLEDLFFSGLKEIAEIKGLEIPFYGTLHKNNVQAFLKRLPQHWNYVLTCLPGTMDRLATNSAFGLASANEAGRQAAIRFIAKARDATKKLNDFYGACVVKAVEIHSAPKGGVAGAESSVGAFVESLAEIRSWNWDGATILVEHCDAYRPGQNAAKGFLTLQDEIFSIQQTNGCATPAGININWARSAIEGRQVQTPVDHIVAARDAHCLQGLFFSGCTSMHPLYGQWADSHAPFNVLHGLRGEPNSLLDISEMKRCLYAAGNFLKIMGIKIQPFPTTLGVSERLQFIADAVKALELSQQ